jgi:hypothetical protein
MSSVQSVFLCTLSDVIYLYESECMYVCMFQHNYISVNGIVLIPSSTRLYKYKEEYKQEEM